MQSSVFNPMEIDAIGEIMNISLGSSATAVSNMLDHRVDITTPKVTLEMVEDFKLGALEPAIGVEIKYVSGLAGSNIMLLKRSDVKVIVDILMGTDTPDEEFELNELTVSAVCEVMNQMMGAASTALSDFLGKLVNISTPQSFELDDFNTFKEDHFPATTGPVVVVRFTLSIEGALRSEFINVMSVPLARELIASFGLGDEPEEAPAPSGGGTLSQAEIERLMSSMGGTDTPPPPPPAAEPSGGGTLSQAEIERLMSSMGGADTPPPPPPAAEPSGGGTLSQAEIERLMGAMGGGASAPSPQQSAGGPPPAPAVYPPVGAEGYPPPAGQPGITPGCYPPYYPYPPYPPMGMYPPQQQQQQAPPPEPKVIATQPVAMPQMDAAAQLGEEQAQNLDLIMEVSLEVSVEIGRTHKKVQDILTFSKGSLVVLDKLAGDQVDLFVNGQCVARGDVVVIDDNFGIRITEILKKTGLEELVKHT